MDFKDLFSDLDDDLTNILPADSTLVKVVVPEKEENVTDDEILDDEILDDEILDEEILNDEPEIEKPETQEDVTIEDDITAEDIVEDVTENIEATSDDISDNNDIPDDTPDDENTPDNTPGPVAEKLTAKTDPVIEECPVETEPEPIAEVTEPETVAATSVDIPSESHKKIEDDDLAGLFDEDEDDNENKSVDNVTSNIDNSYPVHSVLSDVEDEHDETPTTPEDKPEEEPAPPTTTVIPNKNFYTYIRRRRIEFGFDEEDVAELSGLKSSYITNIEKELAIPSKEEADKILHVLAIPDDERANLFDISEPTDAVPEEDIVDANTEISVEGVSKTDTSDNEISAKPEKASPEPEPIPSPEPTINENKPEDEPEKLDKSTLGSKLQFLRDRVGMSVDDVSDDTGISPEDIIKYENGDDVPTEDELRDFAGCYGVLVKELVTDDAYMQRTDGKKTEYPSIDPEDIAKDMVNELMVEAESKPAPKPELKQESKPDSKSKIEVKTPSKADKPKKTVLKKEDALKEDLPKKPNKTSGHKNPHSETKESTVLTTPQEKSVETKRVVVEDEPIEKQSSESGSHTTKIITIALVAIVLIFAIFGSALIAYGVLNNKNKTIEEVGVQTQETEVQTESTSWVEPENFSEALSEYDRAALYINEDDMNLLKQYKDYNSDVYGLIKIEDTVLNHPFAYTPDDESFYLSHDLDKNKNSHGVPFMVAGCRLGQKGTNTVIYGHNITIYEKDVFADISQYEKIDFYKEHPYIETVTEYGSRKWLIFAYYLVDTNDNEFNYWETTSFNSQSDFKLYMEKVTERNWISSSIPLDINDSYLTLSSCSNELAGSGTNRMVLMAKLLTFEEDCDSYIESAVRGNPLLPMKLR